MPYQKPNRQDFVGVIREKKKQRKEEEKKIPDYASCIRNSCSTEEEGDEGGCGVVYLGGSGHFD